MQKTTPSVKPKVARTPNNRTVSRRSGVPDNVPLIRVNFDISRSEHTKLKMYAAKNGVSMADILRSFVTKLKLTPIK
jgi:hypothetical protein